jgi:DMSO/TMAO reductase YedYZ molybdopterin-dependent catalytic subunit
MAEGENPPGVRETDEQPHDERRLRTTRRRFLVGLGALAAGSAGLFAVIRAVLGGGGGGGGAAGSTATGAASTTTGAGSASTGAGPKPVSFPALHVEAPRQVSPEDWVVTVDGLVDKPLRLDHAAWSALARRDVTADFHCVTGWSVDRLRWGGVAPRTLLDMAGLKAGATDVGFHALGGVYSDSLPLSLVDDAQTLLADTLDEHPLPQEHGGPLRLACPSSSATRT